MSDSNYRYVRNQLELSNEDSVQVRNLLQRLKFDIKYAQFVHEAILQAYLPDFEHFICIKITMISCNKCTRKYINVRALNIQIV